MPKKKQEKAKGQRIDFSTIGRLLSYLAKGYTVQFVIVVVLIFVSSLVSVSFSLFLQVVIDDYITPMLLEANPVFSGLLREIVKMAVIALVGITAGWVYNRIMARVSQGILKDIRDEMFEHMQTLPIGYFDSHAAGDIMSYYTNDTDTLRQMLSQSLPQMISSVITIITVAVAMIIANIYLAIFVAVYIFFMLKIIGVIAGRSGKYFMQQQKAIGALNGYIEEMMEGQKVVKVFTHENKVIEEFGDLNETLAENATAANKYANILMPTMGNLGNLLYILIAIIGGGLAISGFGGLTLGVIASFLQLSKSITQPMGQISQQLNMVVMALAGAGRIFSFLDENPEQDSGYVTLVNAKYDSNDELVEADERTNIWAWKHPHSDGTTTYALLEGRIRFYDVDFAYVAGKPVLHDISLYAETGQKLAFVGATGAGKTTITNLINRFYDIADGKIRYDDININKIKKSDLRRSLGVVLQDTHLFTGTIEENIRYGRLNANDDEVRAAATLANADEFITRLPDGYQTMLTDDGEGLSQGQRQLLSIARAAVADPPVMILDEATSSIDTRTELLVQSGMDALMYGRTVFVIAHRLSTIKNSDVIMVMELGRIVEKGNHDSLIEQQGKYYQLYTGSFELGDFD